MIELLSRTWSWLKKNKKEKVVVSTVTNEPTADQIKEKYKESQKKFELLRSEVICCARQVKILLAIAQAKEEFNEVSYDCFWGWMQINSLRSIAVDAFKLSQETSLSCTPKTRQ